MSSHPPFRRARSARLALAAAILLPACLVPAQTTFTGPGTDWFVTGNWSFGTPAAGTDATIAGGFAATLASPGAAARGLTLGSGTSGSLTVTGSGTNTDLWINDGSSFAVTGTGVWTNANTFAVQGNQARIDVSAGGTLTTGTDSVSSQGWLDYGGAISVTGAGSSWTSPGSLTLYTGSVALADHATASTGATTMASSYADNVATAAITAGAQWTATSLAVGGAGSATVTVNGGTLTLARDSSIGAGGSVTVSNGGTLQTATDMSGAYPYNLSVGGGSTLTVTGSGSTWTSPGSATVGSGGAGTFNLQNGATATLARLTTGLDPSDTGTVLIDGAGSRLTTTDAGGDNLGFNGASNLTVSNGGRYDAQGSDFIIGYQNAGHASTVTVTGSGSQLNLGGHLSLGNFGEGTLTVSNGAKLTSGSDASIAFGVADGNAGTIKGAALVTGAGSLWTINGNLGIGSFLSASEYSIGSLTVASGGTVTVGSTGTGLVQLDRKSTLNIGNGGTAGTLNAGAIEFYTAGGTSDSTINFNHTDALTFAVPINSNASWGGQGQVIKSGSGTLTLTGTSNYDGPTWIKGGTISVASLANVGTSSNLGAPATTANGRIKLGATTVAGTLQYTGGAASTNRGLDLAGTTGGGAIDASGTGALTISGTVNASGAGVKTLTLTGTNTAANTLSGAISDNTAVNTTALLKTGAGKWVVSGTNGFTGGVTISAGTLRATNASALGTGVSTLTLGGGTLELGNNTGTAFNRNTTVTGSAAIISDRAGTGSGVTHTLGTLAIGAQTLSIARGSFAAGGTGGITFGATTLGGNATFSVGSNAALTLGAIGDGGSAFGFTKSGAGSLTLTADNTFTGAITIAAGTLNVGNGGAAGTVTGAITNNGTLAVNRTGSLTFGGAISGSGTLTKSGSGTLTLSGDNTYAGATTVSAGTVIVTRDNALGTAAAGTTVGSGATLGLQGGFAYATAEALTLSTSNTGGLSNLSGTNSFAGAITVSGLSRILAASGSQLTLSGVLSGSAQVSTNGGGTLVFSNSGNTLSGAITIGGGTTLVAAANQALGSAGGTAVSVNSGTLAFASGVNYTSNKMVTFAGTGAIGRSAAIDTAGGDATFAGTLQPTNSLATIGAAAGTRLTLSGTISEYSGAIGFGWGPKFVGSGTVVVSGSNSVTSFEVASGTLRATTSANALGLGSLTLSGGALELANDSGLAFNRPTTVTASVAVTSDRLTSGAGVTHTLGSLAIGAQTLTVNRGVNATGVAGVTFGTTTLGGNATFSPTANALLTLGAVGETGGARSLTKSGNGTLALTAAGTYSGGTFLNGGILAASANGQLGAAAGALTFDGGTLRTTADFASGRTVTLNAGGGGFDVAGSSALTWNGNIGGTGALTKSGTGLLVLGGSNNYAGTTFVNAGTLRLGASGALSANTTLQVASGAFFDANGYALTFADLTGSGQIDVGSGGLTVQSGGTSSFDGALSGSGGFTMSGSGTLSLNNANSYAGPTAISGGTVKLGAAGALPDGTPLQLSSGATLNLNGHAAILGKLAGSGTIATGGANLSIAQSSNSTFSGAIDGNGGLVKSGTGILTLSGTNGYAGGTSVLGGTLLVDGSAAHSTFTVASGAVLGGHGTVGALIVASGGTFSPGNSPGLLTVGGDLTLLGTTVMELAGTARGSAYDATDVGGTINFGGTLSVVLLDGFAPALHDTFNLFDGASGATGTFSSVSLPALSPGLTWDVANLYASGSLTVASAVPEPATWAVLVGTLALSLAILRRRSWHGRRVRAA